MTEADTVALIETVTVTETNDRDNRVTVTETLTKTVTGFHLYYCQKHLPLLRCFY